MDLVNPNQSERSWAQGQAAKLKWNEVAGVEWVAEMDEGRVFESPCCVELISLRVALILAI